MARAELELTAEQARRLEELALARRVSMQEPLNGAVENLLRTSSAPKPLTEEQRLRALALSGRFDPGVDDWAENHDKYLAEAFGS